jgi:hypothetical protein
LTSDELVAYTGEALPRLARLFPQLVMRAGNATTVPGPNVDGTPDLEQKLKFQASESSFPLIAVPK